MGGTRGNCCLNWERSSEPPQWAFVEEPTFGAVLMSGRTASHPKAPNHATAEVAAGFSPAILVAQTLISSQCLVTRCTLGASTGSPAALAGNPVQLPAQAGSIPLRQAASTPISACHSWVLTPCVQPSTDRAWCM